ncbi:uncharacterized protein LOC100834209 isoform X1 [Brachypodium distachyon]|uniref:uncharacterized protein LOC100834209 isoform X1 n=1 Tax=Brachypodium distachyon TaxID=15368 RepID=UPI0001C73B89|nr:uncharacterized protein LOC100834209 isoform X1 [Brachypodium distachyon]XP_014755544.1 uncharacterized protein LOC100834209 isoform X1 [Brachypodium distachyon]XP_014755545.1 uncharacterized protein LOC100834209 isoform X1 [Brachypodium distachyon]|eukprot:XP_010234530.1 uncharacterized protein LOC100834209 isoform X1 [Brachypodium distachyon]
MAGVEEDEGEVAALREALRQQRQAVEALKAELEEERQAASSGADEALAMILRLQAEKAAERMEADQFRRVAEERILHDEDSLAFLKAVVFSQEMDIASLKNRLTAVNGGNGDDGLPWLRRLAKNATLPAARLEELCGPDLQAPPPRQLQRSASQSHHRLRRAQSCYSAQCLGISIPVRGNVYEKFEAPESVAWHVPPPPTRSSRRSSPEIISEEEDDAMVSTTRRGKNGDHAAVAELGAEIGQIKCGVEKLATELSRMREATVSRGEAQARLLGEICGKLDDMNDNRDQQNVQGGKNRVASREEGSSSSSSSKGVVGLLPQSELLMNHFIEVCALLVSSALLAKKPLLLRCSLILVLAMVLTKVLMD